MTAKEYDVLIIGSGHSGGMAAHTLTQKGVNCLMLDAGPPVDFARHRGLKPVYELPYRGFGKPGRLPRVFQATEFNANIWADVYPRCEGTLQLGASAAGGWQVDVLGAHVIPVE